MKLNPKLVLDLMHPVGSYYETSDTSFNPNTAWGGTWVEDSKGRVTVGLDSTQTEFDTIGKTGGSKELQEHNHILDITTYTQQGGLGYGDKIYNVRANDVVDKTYTSTTRNAGTGNSGNLQPYVVVKRWHRTA